MTTAKKKTAKKAAKKTVSRKRDTSAASPPSAAPKPGTESRPKEIDPDTLDREKARKRLGAIYKLEKAVEHKKVKLEAASRARRAAKAEYGDACDCLENEIHEQRFGPGPLFNFDGSGAAGTPTEQQP